MSESLIVGSTIYPIHASYDDSGTVLTHVYPDGETVTNSSYAGVIGKGNGTLLSDG